MPLNNWPTTKLHKIVKSKKGKKPKLLDVKQFPGSVEYIDIEAFEKGIIKQYADVASSNLCVETDILVVWDGARFGLIGSSQKGAIGSTLMCLSPVGVNRLYLRYFLELMYPVIQQNPKGMATPHVNADLFWNMDIPLPTEDIQRQIVERLSVILPKVRQVKARLETIPILLKKFRQSVLSAACSGSLIESFNSYNCDKWAEVRRLLNDAKDQIDGFPGHWMLTNLGNLCDGFQYGTSKKSETSGLVPVLRMGNLQNGEVDWSDLKYSSDESDIKKYALSDGDVLFNRTNSPDLVGKTSIYRGQSKAIFAGYLIKIKNRHDVLHSEFLNYCLNSNYGRQWCKEVRTDGVGQSNINASVLASFLIPLPPIEEQIEITIRVQQLLELAGSLESKYQKAMGCIEKIEQSVLAKAFRGEL